MADPTVQTNTSPDNVAPENAETENSLDIIKENGKFQLALGVANSEANKDATLGKALNDSTSKTERAAGNR